MNSNIKKLALMKKTCKRNLFCREKLKAKLQRSSFMLHFHLPEHTYLHNLWPQRRFSWDSRVNLFLIITVGCSIIYLVPPICYRCKIKSKLFCHISLFSLLSLEYISESKNSLTSILKLCTIAIVATATTKKSHGMNHPMWMLLESD